MLMYSKQNKKRIQINDNQKRNTKNIINNEKITTTTKQKHKIMITNLE